MIACLSHADLMEVIIVTAEAITGCERAHGTCTNRQVGTPPAGWRDDTQGHARKPLSHYYGLWVLGCQVDVSGFQMLTVASRKSSFLLFLLAVVGPPSAPLPASLWPRPPHHHEEILLWAWV